MHIMIRLSLAVLLFLLAAPDDAGAQCLLVNPSFELDDDRGERDRESHSRKKARLPHQRLGPTQANQSHGEDHTGEDKKQHRCDQ